jgi:hypothetical protein
MPSAVRSRKIHADPTGFNEKGLKADWGGKPTTQSRSGNNLFALRHPDPGKTQEKVVIRIMEATKS